MKRINFIFNGLGEAIVVNEIKAYKELGYKVESVDIKRFLFQAEVYPFRRDDAFYKALGKSWEVNFPEDFEENIIEEEEELNNYIVSVEEVKEGFIELNDWPYEDMV
jgi:hypothetical protein